MLKLTSFKRFYLYLIIILGIGISCSTTGNVERTSGKNANPSEKTEKSSRELTSELELASYRSKLSDVYATEHKEIPEVFTQKMNTNENIDRYDGYRIQIISTRNVAIADSTSKHFKEWIDALGVTYQPNTYIIFKQPYYRVHVGDFSQSNKAYNFSRIVKKKYPDAWVVHDRINPDRAPADTLKIEINKNRAQHSDSLKVQSNSNNELQNQN